MSGAFNISGGKAGMKKRIFTILLAAMMTSLLLAGCKKTAGTPQDSATKETEEAKEEEADSEEESGLLLGYSCINMDNPYYQTLEKAIETSIGTDARVISMGAEADAQKQNEQIQEMINMGVDAVFLCPVDWEEIGSALEALDEAGIPVINLDTQVKDSDLTAAFIGSDNKNAGYVCGKDLKEKCPDGGKILIFEAKGINSVNERITGFEQSIANAGFEVLNRADANGEKQKAYEQMKEFLKQYPDIDAVMCGTDEVALGVLQAVNEAGRTDIYVYGVDGSPEAKEEIAKDGSAFAGTGAQSPINMGKDAAKTVLAVLENKDYEKEIEEETFIINKDNVELYGTNGWQ